jgi:hypothetical protein
VCLQRGKAQGFVEVVAWSHAHTHTHTHIGTVCGGVAMARVGGVLLLLLILLLLLVL